MNDHSHKRGLDCIKAFRQNSLSVLIGHCTLNKLQFWGRWSYFEVTRLVDSSQTREANSRPIHAVFYKCSRVERGLKRHESTIGLSAERPHGAVENERTVPQFSFGDFLVVRSSHHIQQNQRWVGFCLPFMLKE